MRRRAKRILIAALLLLLVFVVTVQSVLWTDYPRRLVIARLEEQLRLRVQAERLSTGWLGRTTLTNVRLSLPLAETAFFEVPQIRIRHTELLPMVFRGLTIRSVELQSPSLIIRQRPDGTWDIEEAVELLTSAIVPAEPPVTPLRPPRIPRFALHDGTIELIPLEREITTISGLSIDGRPLSRLLYEIDVAVPDHVHVTGQVVPGGIWQHEMRLSLRDVQQWLDPFMTSPPTRLNFDGRWAATTRADELAGRLDVERAEVNMYTASGVVEVERTAEAIALSPRNLLVRTADNVLPHVRVASGTVRIEQQTLHSERLNLATLNGRIQIDGQTNLTTGTGQFTGRWDDLEVFPAYRHGGRLTAELRTPSPGRNTATIGITTSLTMPRGRWDATLTLDGSGPAWNEMDWIARLDQLRVTGPRPLELANLSLRLSHEDDVLRMTRITWPAAERITGAGQINFRDMVWALDLNARGPVLVGQTTIPLELVVQAHGQPERTELAELHVNIEDMTLEVSGVYQHPPKDFLNAHLSVTHRPELTTGPDDPTVRGVLWIDADLEGNVVPELNLKATGSLFARDLMVGQREIGDAKGVLEAHIDRKGVTFETTELVLLGGDWKIRGGWPVDDEILRATLEIRGLSLADLGSAMNVPELRGTAGGQWNILIDQPHANRITMSGDFVARDVALEPLFAESITGKLSIRDGMVRLEDVLLRQDEATAELSLRAPLRAPSQVVMSFASRDWPLEFTAVPALLSVTSQTRNLNLDLRDLSATGELRASVMLAFRQQPVGEIELDTEFRGKVVEVRSLTLDGLGGNADGVAVIDGAEPLRSTARLNWSNIDGERVARIFPEAQGLRGSFSGWASMHPSTHPRAMEPVRLWVVVEPQQAMYRALELGPGKFSAFTTFQRLVLSDLEEDIQEQWNVLNIGEGQLRLWGRVGPTPDRELHAHVFTELTDVNLDQIVQSINPESEEMPGRISGQFTITGNPHETQHLFGAGNVELRRTDLVNSDIMSFLYRAMRVGIVGPEPRGRGSTDVRLEQSTLFITNMRYFNRGVDVRAQVDVSEIWKLPQSPMSGTAVGSARPLRDIRVPLVRDVDRMLGVIQQDLTSVRIGGTVAEPEISLMPFGELGETMRRFLLGEVRPQSE